MDLGKCTFAIGGHQGYIGTTNITEDRLTQSLSKDSNTPIDCIWTISVKEDYQIFIKFAEPQLAFPNDCHLNYLQVRKACFRVFIIILESRNCRIFIPVLEI